MAFNPGSILTTGQVSVGTNATLISPTNLGGLQVTIQNMGTTAVFIGDSGLTLGNGFLLPGVAGASITLPLTEAIYGITQSGTDMVAFATIA